MSANSPRLCKQAVVSRAPCSWSDRKSLAALQVPLPETQSTVWNDTVVFQPPPEFAVRTALCCCFVLLTALFLHEYLRAGLLPML